MPTADYPFDHVTHGPYHVVMPLVIAAMTAAAAQDEDVEAEHLVLALAENVELPDDAHQVPEVAMEAAGEIERADELAEANTFLLLIDEIDPGPFHDVYRRMLAAVITTVTRRHRVSTVEMLVGLLLKVDMPGRSLEEAVQSARNTANELERLARHHRLGEPLRTLSMILMTDPPREGRAQDVAERALRQLVPDAFPGRGEDELEERRRLA